MLKSKLSNYDRFDHKESMMGWDEKIREQKLFKVSIKKDEV